VQVVGLPPNVHQHEQADGDDAKQCLQPRQRGDPTAPSRSERSTTTLGLDAVGRRRGGTMGHGHFRSCEGGPASSARSRWATRARTEHGSWRLAVLFGLGLGLGALLPLSLSCGSSGLEQEAPVPALASSPDAGSEFAELVRAWWQGSREQRQGLDRGLRIFERRYPDDDLGRMARVLRAWNALDRNELGPARELGNEAALGPPGVARDLGNLIVGAVDRRRGYHGQALARLSPLMHKLIDPQATTLLDEELVRAALGAHQWQRAIDTMAAWLRETDAASRASTVARVEELLGALAAPELLAALSRFAGPEASSADEDMARLVAARLAELARAERDAKLARVLVDRFGQLLGKRGEDMARLAGSTNRARVTGRTIGLVLSLGDAELRRRTADVAMGMAFGLGIPGSGARLVSRDGRASADELGAALTELSTDGAAVVVAGVDPVTAGLAARYARASSLPIILLSAPPDEAAADSPVVFVLGEHPERTAQMLGSALRAAGARQIARLGGVGSAAAAAVGSPPGADQSNVPSTMRELGCGSDLDLAALRAAAVDALLVHDGAACGPEVLAAARSLHLGLGVGLGVPGLGPALPSSTIVLAAGVFPVDPKQPRAELRAWLSSGRSAPSWWAALGRDAAVLGWAAVRDMKDVATEDPSEVAARRAEVAQRLGAASEALWTAEAKSFGPDRRLARDVVAHVGPGGSSDAAR
jgi:hypothetical protein